MLGLDPKLAKTTVPAPVLHNNKVERKSSLRIYELFEHLTNSYAGTLSCQVHLCVFVCVHVCVCACVCVCVCVKEKAMRPQHRQSMLISPTCDVGLHVLFSLRI